MSDEDALAFALDLIGRDSEKQDQLAALLANVDPQNWQTINQYLDELAADQAIDRRFCLRLWRYADVKYLLETASPSDKFYTAGEWCSFGYTLDDVLLEYGDLPDNGAVLPEWGDKPDEMEQRYQQWLEQEAASLTHSQ